MISKRKRKRKSKQKPKPKVLGPKSFLDTSVVHKLQLGTTLMQKSLEESIPLNWYVNNYVRMEYFRRCLIEWIYLYFESAHERYETFGDAWKAYSEGFGRQSKSAVAVLTTMETDGFSFSKAEDKNICRDKLQDFIYSMALQFAEIFKDMGGDPTNCARVRHALKFPDNPADRDGQLLTFAMIFRDVKECRSRCTISHLFTVPSHRSKLDAISNATTTGSTVPKLEKIQVGIDKAKQNPDGITCTLCSSMGDAVIASAVNSGWKLHSMDSVHRPISEALHIDYEIHSSEQALRNSGTT
jgi:hypothetical protein